MRPRTAAAIVVAVLAVTAACGDDDGGSTATTLATAGSQSTTATGAAGGATTTAAPGGGDTTTNTEPVSAFEFLATVEFDPNMQAPDAALGSPDFTAADAIAAELFAGADSSGIEVWVFSVIGSDDVLLVLDMDEDLVSEESAELDLGSLLTDSPTIGEAGITEVVINFRTADSQGDLVLTSVISVAALLESEATGEDLPEDAMRFQINREGGNG